MRSHSEGLWAEMYRQSIQAGRRGAALRAISAIDIALWDLRGKAARMPVMQLLGIHSTRLRCYATGGYYREGYTVAELVREMAGYVEQGFSAVKLKVGKLTAREDAERMKAVRKAIGDEIEILLDANGGWPDSPPRFRPCGASKSTAPTGSKSRCGPTTSPPWRASRRLSTCLSQQGSSNPRAGGSPELLERKAADILQPDATVVGGVGEWLKVAHMAAAFDIPIAPHYNWDIHTQLVATIPNGLFVEYFVRGSDVKVFDEVLANPIYPDQGYIAPRTEPGFGLVFRPEKLEEYRIG